MTDILNIQVHVRTLVVKALNKHNTRAKAAEALGITERSLYDKIREFQIVLQGEQYISQKKLMLKTFIQL